MIVIKQATQVELQPITEIYNDAILHTAATFDTKPKTIEEQRTWFAEHDAKHPLLVAKEGGLVIGWSSLSRWSDRCAYSETAEISLYVKSECQQRGVGRKLLRMIVEEGKKAGLHAILARIAGGNEVSLALFNSEGFETVGVMKEVGRKFGKLLDVHLLQKIYT